MDGVRSDLHDEMMRAQGILVAALETRGLDPCPAIDISQEAMAICWEIWNSHVQRIEELEESLAKHRSEVTNDACGDALQKLWDEIIVARRPNYGDWEYPGQAYRHIKAEFEELLTALALVMKLIDDGVLVRNVLNDHHADWAIRQLPMIEALTKAQEALNPK